MLGVDGVVVGEVHNNDSGSEVLGKYAMIGANIRLVDVRSAQVVYSDSITRQYGQFLDDSKKAAMLGQLSRELAQEFVRKIAPHYVQRDKELLGAGGEAEQANARGIRFAKNGLWDKAQEQFELALKQDARCPAAHNNLAICCEQAGRIREAGEYYEKALQLAPDNEAIQRNMFSFRETLRAPDRTAKQALESQKGGT